MNQPDTPSPFRTPLAAQLFADAVDVLRLQDDEHLAKFDYLRAEDSAAKYDARFAEMDRRDERGPVRQ